MVSHDRLSFPNTKRTSMFQRFALSIGGSRRRNSSTSSSRGISISSVVDNKEGSKRGNLRRHTTPQLQQQYNVTCQPLKLKPKHRGNELAIVACGNFWTPQHRFSNVRTVCLLNGFGWFGPDLETPPAGSGGSKTAPSSPPFVLSMLFRDLAFKTIRCMV